jgi:hypothetical protein
MDANRYRPVPSSLALLTVFACTSPERDLGRIIERGADGAVDMPVEMESPEGACPLDPREEQLPAQRQAKFLSEFVGTWIGQAEDALGNGDSDGALPIYAFPSGSTRILLEVSGPDPVVAELTFGVGEPLPPSDRNVASPPDPDPDPNPDPGLDQDGAESSDLPPADGFVYSARPVANALDVERSGADEALAQRLALDGKLVLAFSTADAIGGSSSTFVSELHLRFAGEDLIGVFDGLSLINERGFLTRPGRVRFRLAASALGDAGRRD